MPMFHFLYLRWIALLLGMGLSMSAHALTAEQVLGEYWKDPIFGQAAASFDTRLEVLNGRIWPSEFQAPKGQNARFVFINKTDQPHLLAFTRDEDALLKDVEFKKFAMDELFHAEQMQNQPRGGHHHSGSSADDAQDIVKTMSQRPSVFVSPGEEKEILIRLEHDERVSIICVLDEHYDMGYRSVLEPVSPDEIVPGALQQIY